MFKNQRSIYRPPEKKNTLMFTSGRNHTKSQLPHKPSITSPLQVKSATTLQRLHNKTSISQPKVLLWGPPFWYLFHSMAEKVKEEVFSSVRVELLNIIFLICQNLPCPDCTNHATQYLNSVNFKAVQTKNELKDILFIFHNTVNERKGNPIFSRKELDEKYEKANMQAIWQNFMAEFTKKQKSVQMIANDFHRANISKVLKLWYQTNVNSFQ